MPCAHGGVVAALRHVDVTGERGMAERAQIDLRDTMFRGTQRRGDTARGFQFHAVPLAVVERERVALEAFPARIRQTGGGIEPTAE